MGIIRLILITLVALFVVLWIWGDDEGLPETRLERTPEPTPVAEPDAPPATEPITLAPAATDPALVDTEAALANVGGAGAVRESVTDLLEEAETALEETEPATTPPIAVPETAAPTPPAITGGPRPETRPDSQPTPAPQPATAPKFLTVTGSRVNLREGPDTTHPVVTALTSGTRVEDLGREANGWHQLRTSDGTVGYMSGDFLSPTN